MGLGHAHEAWIGSAPAPFHAAGGAETEVRSVSNCTLPSFKSGTIAHRWRLSGRTAASKAQNVYPVAINKLGR